MYFPQLKWCKVRSLREALGEDDNLVIREGDRNFKLWGSKPLRAKQALTSEC